MKKQTKGILLFAFLGGIMVTSGVVVVMPGLSPDQSSQTTTTGTPADNFPDDQRAQFCGTGSAKENNFVKEYKIPTQCTQPLAITSDSDGNVWFAQTNTGKVSKFDPSSESFVEFENPFWPPGGRSMIWGMDYAPDNSVWYTDEAYDSIWKFIIDEQRYLRLDYPSSGDSLPQRLKIDGSQIIINDFTGGKITFLDPASSGGQMSFLSLPSPINGSVTSGFDIDSENNVWYTNWIFQRGGVLIKFDQDLLTQTDVPLHSDALQVFPFPDGMTTPNGITALNDSIWIADTSSSYFFRFDPNFESFTKYVTSDPLSSTYGNASGIIKSPVSRPYWTAADENGRIVFNEQTANRIAIFDPKNESLIEYLIPSKNPNWADCGDTSDCGLAQIFDFTISDKKIWFTEWAENNIGFVDTSRILPFEINVFSNEVSISPGNSIDIEMQITPITQESDFAFIVMKSSDENISISSEIDSVSLETSQTIPLTIHVGDSVQQDSYKILVGAQNDDVTISKFVTLKII